MAMTGRYKLLYFGWQTEPCFQFTGNYIFLCNVFWRKLNIKRHCLVMECNNK